MLSNCCSLSPLRAVPQFLTRIIQRCRELGKNHEPVWPERSVSFWYDCSGCSGPQPDWPSLLRKVKAHKAAMTSIILFCGVEIAPRGRVAGLQRWNSSACATQLVPSLLRLGVRVEMGIQSGTSDVRDYRQLFVTDPQDLAHQLAALGRVHGLSGWLSLIHI